MGELESRTVLYEKPGPANTDRTLALAAARARELGLDTALVASSSGATGLRAVEVLGPAGLAVVVVTHSTGFIKPDYQELTDENRAAIEAKLPPVEYR